VRIRQTTLRFGNGFLAAAAFLAVLCRARGPCLLLIRPSSLTHLSSWMSYQKKARNRISATTGNPAKAGRN